MTSERGNPLISKNEVMGDISEPLGLLAPMGDLGCEEKLEPDQTGLEGDIVFRDGFFLLRPNLSL